MEITFITKQGKVQSYKTLGKDCRNFGVGQEMEEIHLHNVSIKSEEDAQNLIDILNVSKAGFIICKNIKFSIKEWDDLIRRTD